jgi:hypothetical protein
MSSWLEYRIPPERAARNVQQLSFKAMLYNASLRHVVLAEVTSNLQWVNDPACVTIDITTADGRATGLHKNGVVSCLHLVTMNMDRIEAPIGRLSQAFLQRLAQV